MDGNRFDQWVHAVLAERSRRDGVRLLLATMIGMGGAVAQSRLSNHDVAAGKKHLRRCKRRKKRCKRDAQRECQTCRATAPLPPPDWTDTQEAWVDEFCTFDCMSFCALIWCWSF